MLWFNWCYRVETVGQEPAHGNSKALATSRPFAVSKSGLGYSNLALYKLSELSMHESILCETKRDITIGIVNRMPWIAYDIPQLAIASGDGSCLASTREVC